MSRRAVILVVVFVVLAIGGIGAAVMAATGESSCQRTTLSVSDPGSPKTMKVYRKNC
jgi:hypothetical protein